MGKFKRGDTVWLCGRRPSGCYDVPATVRYVHEGTVSIMYDIHGHDEIIDQPEWAVRAENNCHNCVHGLRKLVSGDCPAKYWPKDE